MATKKLLVIDDDADICTLLARFLGKHGYDVTTTGRGSTGAELLSKNTFDLVLCDHRLPDTDSLHMLERIKRTAPKAAVIIITGYSDVRIAVELMRRGAFDYVVKPLYPDEILLRLEEAYAWKNERSGHASKKPLEGQGAYLKGTGAYADVIAKHIELVAPTGMSVLIMGETGTGKEYVANEIRRRSSRADKPFVAVDCGALPQDLAGSELFGHVKGAFTGSIADKKGSFEQAEGGTLFLDEVGNLTYEDQVRLLRVLQERRIKRIGGETEIPVDVRILAATNEDLKQAVAEGRFREDLFHRINEFTIELLPLRQRAHDIPALAEHFRGLAEKQLDRTVTGFDDQVLERLKSYSWPGNLRELSNFVKRAVLLAKGKLITMDLLPGPIATGHIPTGVQVSGLGTEGLRQATDQAERRTIMAALEEARFNKSRTAEVLNIDRKTLYNKMKALGIEL